MQVEDLELKAETKKEQLLDGIVLVADLAALAEHSKSGVGYPGTLEVDPVFLLAGAHFRHPKMGHFQEAWLLLKEEYYYFRDQNLGVQQMELEWETGSFSQG